MKRGYKAKTLIDGFKLGMQYAGRKFVGVPMQNAIPGSLVFHGNKLMKIQGDPVTLMTQDDKFGRGTFTLCYYEWEPTELWV
jgi:hypothetical protein